MILFLIITVHFRWQNDRRKISDWARRKDGMESIWWMYISMKNNKSNDIQKNRLSSIGIYRFKNALDGWIDTNGNEIWTALNGEIFRSYGRAFSYFIVMLSFYCFAFIIISSLSLIDMCLWVVIGYGFCLLQYK